MWCPQGYRDRWTRSLRGRCSSRCVLVAEDVVPGMVFVVKGLVFCWCRRCVYGMMCSQVRGQGVKFCLIDLGNCSVRWVCSLSARGAV